jgi:hypothetical protein
MSQSTSATTTGWSSTVNKFLDAARQRTALGWFIVAVTVFVITSTACSGGSKGPGVAKVDSKPGTASASSTSAVPNLVAYSQCMRDHGITRFPDPDSAGRLKMDFVNGGDLDPNSAQFHAAQSACKSVAPAQSQDVDVQQREEWLKFAQCMRAHGIANFPDPRPDGRLLLPRKDDGSPSVDSNSPQFQAADKACKQYSPGGGSGGGVGG